MTLQKRTILVGTAIAATVAMAPMAYATDDVNVATDDVNIAIDDMTAAEEGVNTLYDDMHAVVTCQSASFYTNYDHALGRPVGFKRTLYYGNKVGHKRGAHPVYNGWASAIDYGPNEWGFLLYSCIGLWGTW